MAQASIAGSREAKPLPVAQIAAASRSQREGLSRTAGSPPAVPHPGEVQHWVSALPPWARFPAAGPAVCEERFLAAVHFALGTRSHQALSQDAW